MKRKDDGEITELVTRAQQGDTDAFELLYRRFIGPVYTLAFRMTASREQAEDLTQEIFIKAWEKLHLFRGDSAFFSWLYKLALRICLRARNSAQAGEYREEMGQSTNSRTQGRSDQWSAEDSIDLQKAITRLPPRTRAAIILFDINGYSHQEVAVLLGIREGTSKALIHKGRRRLRQEIER